MTTTNVGVVPGDQPNLPVSFRREWVIRPAHRRGEPVWEVCLLRPGSRGWRVEPQVWAYSARAAITLIEAIVHERIPQEET